MFKLTLLFQSGFFDTCSLDWWKLGLMMLIPFLLGWWFRNFTVNKWKRRAAELEDEIKGLNGQIADLNKELEDCKYARNRLDGEVAMMKGRMREIELEAEDLKGKLSLAEKQAEDAGKAAASAASAAAPVVKKDPPKPVVEKKDPPVEKIAAAPVSSLTGDSSTGSNELSDDDLSKGKSVFGFKIKQNDLKLIEGVGPKIEGLLKDAGLVSWRDVGNANVDRIKEILEAAGPRYRLADPTTWPQQASFAADAKWEELKAFQDKLDGGKLA